MWRNSTGFLLGVICTLAIVSMLALARTEGRRCVGIAAIHQPGFANVSAMSALYRAWDDGTIDVKCIYVDPNVAKALPSDFCDWKPMRESTDGDKEEVAPAPVKTPPPAAVPPPAHSDAVPKPKPVSKPLWTVPPEHDVVTLKSGRTLEGVILATEETQIRLRVPVGEITVLRADIQTVEHVKPPADDPPAATGDDDKTVHVKGYYRKDGTYVQPYNRLPPRH